MTKVFIPVTKEYRFTLSATPQTHKVVMSELAKILKIAGYREKSNLRSKGVKRDF